MVLFLEERGPAQATTACCTLTTDVSRAWVRTSCTLRGLVVSHDDSRRRTSSTALANTAGPINRRWTSSSYTTAPRVRQQPQHRRPVTDHRVAALHRIPCSLPLPHNGESGASHWQEGGGSAQMGQSICKPDDHLGGGEDPL